MATKNLSGLFTPSGDKITSEAWSKQFINNLGIPVVMADMVGVSYTVSSGKDDMGDTIQVATIVTLENKLNEINSAIAAKGTGTVKKISINGTEKTPDANGVVNLGTGFLTSTDVTNKGASLTPNATVTLATIGGKNITAAVPAHKLSIATPTVTQEQGTAPLTISANPSITTNAASAEENISIQNIKLLGVDTNTKVTVNGVEIGLSVVNNKICLTHSGSEVVPEVRYATLSTSTNSLVINDGATSNQFTISQEYLTGVSLSYSQTNASSYFVVSYSLPNIYTVNKKSNVEMTAGTDYTCDIYLTGTPATGVNTSKLTKQTVSLTIKAPAAPVSKPITAISMTLPKANYSAAATITSTYTCSKTITPTDFTTGGPVTLSLYTNAAHTTKYTGSNVSVVNGDKLQFTGPDKVYPRYEAANGVNTNSTQFYVEYKQTASQFNLASDTTSVTIGGSASTVNLTTTGIKYYTATPTYSYFTVDTSDSSKVKITPVSSYAMTSAKNVDVVLTPTVNGVWYSSAAPKTLKVTVNPKAAAAPKYGYYGFIDMPEDGSFVKESTFTKDITDGGNITITPVDQKVIAILTKANARPGFTYETGNILCTGDVYSGDELGISSTMTMNGQMYYVWLVVDVMSSSWTNVVLNIK